jgi:hypothetical protein
MAVDALVSRLPPRSQPDAKVRRKPALVVLDVARFQIQTADSLIERGLGLFPRGGIRYMRKSKGDLVWEFIALCNDRNAEKKIRELERSQITTLTNG